MLMRKTLLGLGGLALFVMLGTMHAAALSNADKQFMAMAAKANMTEAHQGQMAEKQASRADVKDLAKTIVQDHTEAYEHLTELAAKTGVAIPKGIDAGKNPTIQQLVHLKGSRFDTQFARDEVIDHKRAIAAFKQEAAHGQDADVKDYASKMIPVLEKHLHLAEECAKPVKRS
jgi:putative membrane protein